MIVAQSKSSSIANVFALIVDSWEESKVQVLHCLSAKSAPTIDTMTNNDIKIRG